MDKKIQEDKSFLYKGKYTWSYYSKKAMKQKYPEGGYKVIGEVIKKPGENRDFSIIDNEGNKLFVQPLKTYKKLLYKKIGYIWSEEHQGYVVVKKNNLLMLLLSIIALLLLIGGLIWWGIGFNNGPNIDSGASAWQDKIERPADWDESKILIPGYNDWKMEANTNEVYIALFNPDKNPCYFQFEIILNETKEILYTTGLIPPGNAVTTVKLPRKFSEGIYPITVRINSYSLDDHTQPLNGGEVKVNLIAMARE